jgi:hypothetical protein
MSKFEIEGNILVLSFVVVESIFLKKLLSIFNSKEKEKKKKKKDSNKSINGFIQTWKYLQKTEKNHFSFFNQFYYSNVSCTSPIR